MAAQNQSLENASRGHTEANTKKGRILRMREDEESPLQQQELDATRTFDIIQRLPPELCLEIFTWCLPIQFKINGPANLTRRTAPLNLVQVCRFWRSMALSCPRLWSYFELGTVSFFQSQKGAAVIRPWLERAASCPLDFFITLHTVSTSWRSDNHLGEEVCDFFTLLAEYQQRWRHVDLRVHCHKNIPWNCHLLKLPSLEELVLRFEQDIDNKVLTVDLTHSRRVGRSS
ncbi:hypothetical protein DFH11DRAFT_422636 [Phellopilus nigrolimitatus]|nr:hypothetical protein DFH11DRAFT_422636 [Phellopilus nigrolimitatus]